MNLQQRLIAFQKLGSYIHEFTIGKHNTYTVNLANTITEAYDANPWFTKEFVNYMLLDISRMLQTEDLIKWIDRYPGIEKYNNNKNIGLVLAGNIPLVGFHDILCALLCGHKIICKLSSKDAILTKTVLDILIDIEPEFQQTIYYTQDSIENADAFIATGSDNSAMYFETYFSEKPNIIRKNRNSLAILLGSESIDDLEKLTDDIFLYFGLGCRNVSKLYVPKNYNFELLNKALKKYNFLTKNSKYNNNYKYSKVLSLMHKEEFIDLGFAILKQDTALSSSISSIHFEYYTDKSEIENYLKLNSNNIQCVVSNGDTFKNSVSFGKSQQPELWDYSDNIDTLAFLLKL